MANGFICDAGASALACMVCSTQFIPKNYAARTCGRKCSNRQAHLTRSANAKLRNARICEQCGIGFQRRNPSGQARRGEIKEGRFCSRVCSAAAVRVHATKRASKAAYRARKRQRDGKPLITSYACTECGKLGRGMACGGECNRVRLLRQQREAYAQDPDVIARAKRRLTCKQCGDVFIAGFAKGERRKARRSFCTDACASRHGHEVQGKNHRQRARYHGVAYEPFRTRDILLRDGYRCMICGIKTPKRLRGSTEPNAPELDHRIPMAMGGGHTRDNTQCACRRCNGLKGGDKIEGQLLLFAA